MGCALAQGNGSSGGAASAPAGSPSPSGAVAGDPILPSPSATPVEDKRAYGVLPNNRTTEASIPFVPLSAGRKMTIGFKDSFDIPAYPTAAIFASIYQLENANPSFGQGTAGYSKRFAAALGDQIIGNMMTEGIVPALVHQDPRYFRLGEGSKKSRVWYAVTQIVVDRTDKGHKSFNVPEWGGNALAVAISNAYSPDTRTAHDNVQKLLVACATDALSNVLKEFWPDVKRHFQQKRELREQRSQVAH